jgi:c-di-GMP-binding flagellar brake protein YcgR
MEERRTVQRYKLPVAVEVRCRSESTESEFIHGKTRDVSTRGLYLNSNQQFAVGTRIALSLTLPVPTDGFGAVVDCEAKVVRVEEDPDARTRRFGIAVVIDSYNYIRSRSAS